MKICASNINVIRNLGKNIAVIRKIINEMVKCDHVLQSLDCNFVYKIFQMILKIIATPQGFTEHIMIHKKTNKTNNWIKNVV